VTCSSEISVDFQRSTRRFSSEKLFTFKIRIVLWASRWLRLERILTMVCVVQSYWACFGLYKVQNKPNNSVLSMACLWVWVARQWHICWTFSVFTFR
jgi:hypothetical protein